MSVCDKGGSDADDLVAFQKRFFMCFQMEKIPVAQFMYK